MNFNSLEPPYLCLNIASPKEFGAYGYRLNYERGSELAIRVVRGNKMRRLDDLYNEFAAAFQFPDYFGENWAAFDECLGIWNGSRRRDTSCSFQTQLRS